jgi:EmrB/QacA subfamily drug resistance transporter
MTAAPTTSAGFDPALRRLVTVVILGAIMTILDTTITTVAVRTLGTGFHAPLSSVQWVLTGYTLALSMSIPLTGWAVVRFGAKTMWIASLLMFIAGSAACGLAWNLASLIAFRLAQGVGAGMIVPIGQTMLARAAGPARMGRVMAAIAVPSMLAPVLGPTVGGLVLGHLSWRWLFYLNVPLCAVAVIAAVRLLPDDQVRDRDSRLDTLGLALLSPALGALVYGTARAGACAHLTDIRVVASVSAGVALLACYILHAGRRGAAALVDVRLLRNRNFAATTVLVFVFVGALSGLTALLPLYFQTVTAATPLRSGAMMAPLGLGAMVTTLVAGRLTDKFAPRRLILAGLSVVPAGIVGLGNSHAVTATAVAMAMLFVIGLGYGLVMPAAMSSNYRTLGRGEIPAATTAANVGLRTASSFGVAVLLVLLQHNTEHPSPAATGAAVALAGPHVTGDIVAALAQPFIHTYWWAACAVAAAVVPALLLPRTSDPNAGAKRYRRGPDELGSRDL